jgi:hypothetical protein
MTVKNKFGLSQSEARMEVRIVRGKLQPVGNTPVPHHAPAVHPLLVRSKVT